MKSKAIELSRKKITKDITKEKNEKLFYEQKTKETKEKIKNLVQVMQNFKKLYDEVDKERDQYVNNVNEKANEI